MCRAEPCSAARPEARPRAGLLFWPTLGRSQERVGIEMGATRMLVAGGIVLAALATPAIALATTCPPPAPGRSEEHTSELQSLMRISYAVFCLKKKKIQQTQA